MGRWVEISGTSKADLKAKAKKVVNKIHQILESNLASYNAERYAQLGSSIVLHKTQLKVIIKMPNATDPKWKKIKNRLGQIPGWVTPKEISNDDSNYFNKIEL